ncbi:MAG: DUF4038 domain-containing protein, partial [Dehalococcoidia bacterium]
MKVLLAIPLLTLLVLSCSNGSPSTGSAAPQATSTVAEQSGTTPAPRSANAEGMSWDRGPLSVSENGRYLVHEDGTPFFWLGDTAWALFHRFTREEAAVYFQNRRERGFNVIQAAALPIGPAGGLDVPNPYGQDALIGRDPTRPAITEGSNQGDADQYDWWDHVDALISMAEEQGLYVG